MTDADWNDIEALFEEALEWPVGQRLKWLESVCADPNLFDEVAAMLRAADKAGDFLSRPVDETASTLIMESRARRSNRVDGFDSSERFPATGRIGRYRIVRRIGWGGAGAVYLGERADAASRLRRFRSGEWLAVSLVARFQPENRRIMRLLIGATSHAPTMRKILLHSISSRLDSTIAGFLGELNTASVTSGQSAVIVSLAQQLSKVVEETIENNGMSEERAEQFRRKCCDLVLDRIL